LDFPLVCGVNRTTMKTLAAPIAASSSEAVRPPDFGGRPRRINLEQTVALKGYGKVKIRPIRVEDEQEMIRFHVSIPEESIYLRYFEYLGLDRRTSHERLMRICANTPESYAIVVEKSSTPHQAEAILGVGRLTKTAEAEVATFDTLLADGANARPLGKALLNRMIKLARAFGFKALTGELLVADHDGLNLCRALGFSLQTVTDDGVVIVTLSL
jgi:acetyltransferase